MFISWQFCVVVSRFGLMLSCSSSPFKWSRHLYRCDCFVLSQVKCNTCKMKGKKESFRKMCDDSAVCVNLWCERIGDYDDSRHGDLSKIKVVKAKTGTISCQPVPWISIEIHHRVLIIAISRLENDNSSDLGEKRQFFLQTKRFFLEHETQFSFITSAKKPFNVYFSLLNRLFLKKNFVRFLQMRFIFWFGLSLRVSNWNIVQFRLSFFCEYNSLASNHPKWQIHLTHIRLKSHSIGRQLQMI